MLTSIHAEPVHCNDCEMLSINGVACHETGCPNIGARFDKDSGEWIKQRKCFHCGFTVDMDASCCNGDDDWYLLNDDEGREA